LALYVQHRKDSDAHSTKSRDSQGEADPKGYPVREVSFRIALNRDVCGGEFADRYGAFIVLSFFAVGIAFELFAIAVFFNKGNGWLVWTLTVASLVLLLVAGITPMIGRLPWDWFKTPTGCKEDSEYRQSFQHNLASVPQKHLDIL